MLTPRFRLEQDTVFLTVTIYAPFTHIDQTEIFMSGRDFRFSSAPYFLRLHLPGEVEETDAASGAWDAETTSFVVKCPKVTEGEHFEGLEMLTQLLTPKGDTGVSLGVEELDGGDSEGEEGEQEEDIEWYFEQKVPDVEEVGCEDLSSYGYGFGFLHTAAYSKLLAEFGEILDLSNPDKMNNKEREAARLEKELKEFNSDHYLSDLLDDSGGQVEECLAWSPGEAGRTFTVQQQEQLLALPRRKPLLPTSSLPAIHLSLADLLYGHCFGLRSGLGETSTEHGWLAAKLSATLSTCARFSSVSSCVRSCLRRSLIYPWLRSWELGLAVWRDVTVLLEAGPVAAVQALLALSASFSSTPGYYIFSQLYLQDYCTWLQAVPAAHLTSLAVALASNLERVTKDSLGLELEELEVAARLTMLEEEEGELAGIVEGMEKVDIAQDETLDSDDDSEESSDDSDDSDRES